MKTKTGKFRQGRGGCESRLYLVRGYHRTTKVTDENDKPTPQDRLRIAANDLPEVIEHIRKWEPGFDVRSICLVSMIVLLSGSPYQE